MTTASCTGTNPHGELLSRAKDLSDSMKEGALSSGDGKSAVQTSADILAGRVFDAANSALREVVLGPAEIAVGPILETLDDSLPQKITIPTENLGDESQGASLVDAFINGFCEDSYAQPDICIPKISKANVQLANAVAQGVRDLVHICARPAEALEEGLQTEVSVELIVNTIKTVSPEIRKKLGLDTFAADLQNKVKGDPRQLLSALLQGTVAVSGNVVHAIPEAHIDRGDFDRSSMLEMAPDAHIQLIDTVSEATTGLSSSTISDVPFTIPKEGVHLGGEELSSSLDVLLHTDISLPGLDLPNIGTGVKSPSKGGDGTKKTSGAEKQDSGQKAAEISHQEQQSSVSKEKEPSRTLKFPKPTDESLSGSSAFDVSRDDRPEDFKTFTGEFSVSFGPDRRAEMKKFAALCSFYEKNGWPKERIEYEVKVRRNKVRHREDKIAGIDLDLKIKLQQQRVKQLSAKVKEQELLHAKTGRSAWKISEASVDLLVEQEFLNRLIAELPKGTKKLAEASSKKGSKDEPHAESKEGVDGGKSDGAHKEQDVKQPSQKSEPIVLSAADIQALETQIMTLDAKIEAVNQAENRANKRVKRYKKWWRKLTQKGLHTVCNARKPGTVVEEETILGTLNHEQKLKLQEEKVALVKKLKEAQKGMQESSSKVDGTESLRSAQDPSQENPGNTEPDKSDIPTPDEQQESRDKQSEDSVKETPSKKGEQSSESEESNGSEDALSGKKLDLLRQLKEKLLLPQEKMVAQAQKAEEYFDRVLRDKQAQADFGKKEFFESKQLEKIAALIDRKLSEEGDRVSLKMKDGQEKVLTREQAQKLKVQALEKAQAKVNTAAEIIGGATAASGLKSGAHRLGKELKKAHVSAANTLGSNAGSAVADLGVRWCTEGNAVFKDTGKIAAEVGVQTAKGVATQVAQNVARSAVKGIVKEIAPEAARYVPGLEVVNRAYAVGSAVLSGNSVGESISNGVSASVDLGITYGCTVAAQTLIPIPFLGAFAGALAGSLVVKGKNRIVSWARS